MTHRARLTFSLFWIALLSLGLWPRLWSHVGLWSGWLAALVFPLLSLYWIHRSRREVNLDITLAISKKQPIQQLAQVMIYVGLSIHWPKMFAQLPLTLAQVAFAFLIDLLWVWSRGGHRYRLSMSPTPIVLSINLFIWFRDEVFYYQWGLIVFAVLSRALFSWERQVDDRGTRKRINRFNPSALAISLAGIMLIMTQTTHLTWGEELAVQHGAGPSAYWVIFSAGLLAQLLAPIGWVTLGGTHGYLVLDPFYFYMFGSYQFIDTAIPPAVFLGLNLLITDPATIPRGRWGQISYGLAYAGLSFLCFSALKNMSFSASPNSHGFNPTFLDKALAIPLLNLCVPLIDRMMGVSKRPIGSLWAGRLTFSTMWVCLFTLVISPRLEEHPGSKLNFWEKRCELDMQQDIAMRPSPPSCTTRDRLLRMYCDRGNARLCYNLALSSFTTPTQRWRLMERSCDGGALRACLEWGEYEYDQALGQRSQVSLSEGDRAVRLAGHLKSAEKAWRLVCDTESTSGEHNVTLRGPACFNLANLYATPWQGERKMVRAVEELTKACDLGVEIACQALRPR